MTNTFDRLKKDLQISMLDEVYRLRLKFRETSTLLESIIKPSRGYVFGRTKTERNTIVCTQTMVTPEMLSKLLRTPGSTQTIDEALMCLSVATNLQTVMSQLRMLEKLDSLDELEVFKTLVANKAKALVKHRVHKGNVQRHVNLIKPMVYDRIIGSTMRAANKILVEAESNPEQAFMVRDTILAITEFVLDDKPFENRECLADLRTLLKTPELVVIISLVLADLAAYAIICLDYTIDRRASKTALDAKEMTKMIDVMAESYVAFETLIEGFKKGITDTVLTRIASLTDKDVKDAISEALSSLYYIDTIERTVSYAIDCTHITGALLDNLKPIQLIEFRAFVPNSRGILTPLASIDTLDRIGVGVYSSKYEHLMVSFKKDTAHAEIIDDMLRMFKSDKGSTNYKEKNDVCFHILNRLTVLVHEFDDSNVISDHLIDLLRLYGFNYIIVAKCENVSGSVKAVPTKSIRYRIPYNTNKIAVVDLAW